MRRVALCCWLLAAGCFGPDYSNGRLRCNANRCPDGLVCAEDRCWLPGQGPGEQPGQPTDPGRDAGPMPDGGSDLQDAPPAEADPTPGPDAAVPAEVGGPINDPRALLASLEVSPGELRPAFNPTTFTYSVDLPLFSPAVSLRATAANPAATVSLDGSTIGTGSVLNTYSVPPGPAFAGIQVNAPISQVASYLVAMRAGARTSYLKPATPRAGERFGSAVALADNTLVVGAPDDTGMTGGAVHVFIRSQTGGQAGNQVSSIDRWTQQATLRPARPHPGMRFGESVAISGDTVLVGAPGEDGAATVVNGPPDNGADEAGAAFVFVRSGAAWTQQAYLKAMDADVGDRFGTSVAVLGDTVAVGAPGADLPNGLDAGVAYVFVRSAGGWSPQALVRAMNAAAATEFGQAVAVGADTLVVGAPREDSGGSGVNPGAPGPAAGDSGAVYVFHRNGSTWQQAAYIKPSNNGPSYRFGWRVAIAGDWLAVGAPHESSSAQGIDRDPKVGTADAAGAVYLYQRVGNGWLYRHYVKPAHVAAGDNFGQAVALNANANGNTLVVGAPGEDGNVVGVNQPIGERDRAESGAVFVFRQTGGSWQQVAYVKAPNAEAGDRFGSAVAVAGDTLTLGADGEDSSAGPNGNTADNAAPDSGAVFVY